MAIYFVLLMQLMAQVCHSMLAYKIEGLDEYGDYGKFTLTVEKEYEFWQQKNKTKYKLHLTHGQSIQGDNFEVRVAF